jgi:FixJ family two-component response regulator
MTHRHIYLVDDNLAFRASAQWWLSGAGYAVREFGDSSSALAALGRDPPQGAACMLLDVQLPDLSGPGLPAQLHALGLAIPIIYMTGQAEVALAVRAMQQGAVSYLEKPFAEQALEEALCRAFADPAGPGVTAVARSAAEEPSDAPHLAWVQRLARLTPREREVHHWVMQDRLNKTISGLLGISIKTVELHRANLMRKLGARSLTHLVKMTVSRSVS